LVCYTGYMKLLVRLLVIALAIAGLWHFTRGTTEPTEPVALTQAGEAEVQQPSTAPQAEVIAENLTIPWEVLFLPDGELLATERPGRVVLLRSNLEFELDGIRSVGEGGLLGAALHPNFEENGYIYLYQTTDLDGQVRNRIVRYALQDEMLTFDRVILDNVPGARFHDGGRIMFGPDGYLYATVGDALSPDSAQDRSTLEGTLLRMNSEGEPAPGNPFNSLVYSYGHRNAQGITWDDAGNLWSSEHGRSGLRSGYDEINLITPGANYGWPESEGDTVLPNTVAPARHSTAEITWAPGDLQYHDGSLYMPGLRGETLYEAVLNGTQIIAWHEHVVGEYGRLRSVRVGPDGLLYLLTSNRDGRGNAVADNDDRIIRINPKMLSR
jgi:glucose/arabinose dehydrogenase